MGTLIRLLAMATALALAAAACGSDGSSEQTTPTTSELSSSTTVDETTTATNDTPTTDTSAASGDIEFLSARPDVVSGGDVLVAVESADATIELNGTDVTDVLSSADDGRRVGLVTGLEEGDNDLVVQHGEQSTTHVVTNHPIEGPIFSGPHLPLPVCTTEALGL
ncbi:MAG: DUF6351 family protein, partial [Acidimicrobiales bacterium]